MLDTSCTGSFMKKTIEFEWDLNERIKRNSKNWELDEGKESGSNVKFDCFKSFMDTDAFHKFSTKYGLDSEIVHWYRNVLYKRFLSPFCDDILNCCQVSDCNMGVLPTRPRNRRG